jgi:hypothetical protein
MDQDVLLIYEQLPNRIREFKNYTVKRDLLRMYRNCENLRRDIAREQVNCRNGRDSHALLQLRNKFTESVTNLDQYVTLALLSI